MTTNNSTNCPGVPTTLANVVSTANTFTAAQTSSPVTVSSSGNLTATNAELGNIFKTTLSENTTLSNPLNLVAGTYYTWVITQGGSPFTLAYGNLFKWPGGTSMTVSTGNAAIDIITSYYDGSHLNTVFSQNFL
jgi:hypothetical protein